jgi:hypothetical protein
MGKLFGLFISFIVGVAFIWILAHFVAIPWVKEGPNVSISTNGIQIINGNNKTTTSKTLAEGYPKAIPIYTPSQVIYSTKNTYNNSTTYFAQFLSTSKSSDIASYYSSRLSTNGWSITNKSSSNNNYSFQASGKGYNISVNIGSVTGLNVGSRFTIQVST